MGTLLDSYFDIEGTRYDIFKIPDSVNCSVVRNNTVLFTGALNDCRRYCIAFVCALNDLLRL